MIDANTTAGQRLASTGVFGVCAAGMSMNALFGISLGVVLPEKIAYFVLSISVDLIKFLAASAAAIAWEKGRYGKSLVAWFIAISTISFGFVAAFGFSAVTRNEMVMAKLEKQRIQRDDVLRLRSNGKRYIDLVNKLDAAKDDKTYIATGGCLDVTAKSSKAFCSLFWKDQNDMRDLENRPKITSDEDMDARMAIIDEPDPLVASIAKATGFSDNAVTTWLNNFVAFIVELISAVGVYAFSKSYRKSVYQTQNQGSSTTAPKPGKIGATVTPISSKRPQNPGKTQTNGYGAEQLDLMSS